MQVSVCQAKLVQLADEESQVNRVHLVVLGSQEKLVDMASQESLASMARMVKMQRMDLKVHVVHLERLVNEEILEMRSKVNFRFTSMLSKAMSI
jgi:hypothetical protein